MIVVLKADEEGEDGAYTIGAVLVSQPKTLDDLKTDVASIKEKLLEELMDGGDYEDEGILTELVALGYTLVDPPEELFV